MSSYSEYLSRQKQRVTQYLDTRPRRDAGHQTEIVKRLAASGVQDAKNPTPAGVLVLDGPSTRVRSFYPKAHTVQDTSVYNDYTAGQAVAQSEKSDTKPSQLLLTCCAPDELQDKMVKYPEFAKVVHARQGVRADCCSQCGKVYDAAVCGCINRVPVRPSGPTSCEYTNLQGTVPEYDNPPPYTDPAADDDGFYLYLGFPFYFYGSDYGTGDDVYYTSNQVIGFGSVDTSFQDWDPLSPAILVGFYDRDIDNFYQGPSAETRGSLTYYQGVLVGRNDHGDDIPNAVRRRYIFGRDETAGYQYIEIQFEKEGSIPGEWVVANGTAFDYGFYGFVPQACTTILLRSDLNGNGWTLIPNQTLGVPLPPPLLLMRSVAAPKKHVTSNKTK